MFNRISILSGIVLVSTLLLASPPALGQSASDCSDAWDDSAASGSCDSPTFDWYGNNSGQSNCTIETNRLTGEWDLSSYPLVQEKQANSITVPTASVEHLENCSGTLKIWSC